MSPRRVTSPIGLAPDGRITVRPNTVLHALLPTLAEVRAEALAITAARVKRKRQRAPVTKPPWIAVPVVDEERFSLMIYGNLHTVVVCACAVCATVLAEALRLRNAQGRSKAKLLLFATGGSQRLLIARGLGAHASNVRISRAWLLGRAPGTMLSDIDAQRLNAGHLVVLPASITTKAASYLVARLPAPAA